MRYGGRFALAAVLLASLGTVRAFAGDISAYPPPLPAPPPSAPPPSPVFEDWNSGWYLRGDIGGHLSRTSGATGSNALITPSYSKLGNGLTAGGGVGYKAGFLRADVTGDYLFPVNYRANVFGTNDVTAKVQITSAMFNGYIDLGTWFGVTPYIGAGAGYSFVKTQNYMSAVVPFTGQTTNSQKNFTYAGMAGLAVKVAPNMQIDFGYRYINYGDINMPDTSLGSMTIRKAVGHEIRAGIRWSFDDLR